MILIFVIGLIWFAISFIDFIFKSCLFHGYIQFLDKYGIVIKPFQIRITSTRFNYLFSRIARKFDSLIDSWLYLGFLVTLLLIPIAIYVLGQSIASLAFTKSSGGDNAASLLPVLPGVNIPMQEIGYYLMALIVASVIHEAGHALAAVRASVRVDGFGLFVFGIVPAAFVDLPTDIFNCCSTKNKLKIVTAGVWHNEVLAGVCAFLLVANPYLLSPLYIKAEGVVVASISNNDIATPPTGLAVGDVLIGVDNCFVENRDHWKSCLFDTARRPSQGYCVPNLFVSQERQMSLVPGKCCGEDSKRHLCFKDSGAFKDNEKLSETNPVNDNQVKPESDNENLASKIRKSVRNQLSANSGQDDGLCLPVRLLLESFTDHCNSTKDCLINEPRCLRPVIDDHYTRLVQIHRENKEPFLFYGYPVELLATVSVTNFKGRSHYLPLKPLVWMENFLRYVASFSLALAILNSVPCFALDGHWITSAIVEVMFRNKLTIQKRTLVTNLITLGGSALVGATISLAFFRLMA